MIRLGQRRLNKVDLQEVSNLLPEMTQFLPIYLSNSQSRQKYYASFFREDVNLELVKIESHEKVLGFLSLLIEGKTLLLTNLLVPAHKNSRKYGLDFWLKHVEKLAKEELCERLQLNLAPVNGYIKNLLVAKGYSFQVTSGGDWQFTKRLNYRRGLVLAGGGARGAFQIGAWRGLHELGITYDLICGTSVGGLNGGLILQGDYQAAEKMWREIETKQILDFETVAEEVDYSPVTLLKTIQRFTFSALVKQGVSTAPLQKLIEELIDEEKMMNSEKEFYICTTELPHLKERVVSIKDSLPGEFHKWLLASSSFFPAMAAAEIAGKYYVDGGYRNNIPIDVALNHGATELLVIDVKGPGLTKPVLVPAEVPIKWVSSPWNLGAVLLFDGARSHWNIELGYLETLKAYGVYEGYWYSFTKEGQSSRQGEWQKQFNDLLMKELQVKGKHVAKTELPTYLKELLKKIRKTYSQDLKAESVSLFVLEYLGKAFNLSPIQLYSVESFSQEICVKMKKSQTELVTGNKMLLTLPEWSRLYLEELPLPTEKQQILYLYHKIKGEQRENLFHVMANIAPLPYLAALVLNHLLGNKDEK